MIKELRANMFTLKYNRYWVGLKGEDSFKILTTFVRIINLISQILFLYTVIREMIVESHDLTTVSLCLFVIGLIGPTLGKQIGLIQYNKIYKNILHELEIGLHEKFKITNDELKHIENAEKWIAKYIRRYIVFTFIGTIGMVFTPLLKKILSYFNLYPKDVSVGFPYPAWSPFCENDYVGYLALYILQFYYVYGVWTLWVGTDAIFAGSIVHLSAHFNIIGDRIVDWKREIALKLGEVQQLKPDLKNIIRYHIEILR